jgi:NAD(P)-dependent dehydrogenase (short-subunit alcohol dehydrogenase family)
MKPTLKPISEQVIVITGASSGIGLVTAQKAARAGARVVLAARNEADLRQAVDEIRAAGGRAIYVVADVADPAQVASIAHAAMSEFGRIDTWVNNAAVSVYGRIMELSVDEMRRQFDVNYWGEVYGSRAAVPHLQREGGAIINVGSVLCDRAIPLQGNYCAAKHALRAFTETLRMELEAEGAPISVTLVKPASIDTPFFEKARTHMEVEPQPVPPVYAPEIVADAILRCAVRPTRDVIVGGSGKLLSAANMAPRIADRYMERTMFEAQRTDIPVSDERPDNLFSPVEHDGGQRGRNWQGRTKGTSVYTTAALRPRITVGALLGLAALMAATPLWLPPRQRSPRSRSAGFRPGSRPLSREEDPQGRQASDR